MSKEGSHVTPQDDELPGMLAVAKGIAEQTFPHTMDAAVWAAEYVKLNPGADEGTMIGWFANAIMAGYDTAQARATRSESARIWIPVGERLPDDPDRNVLVYVAGEYNDFGVDCYRFGPDGDAWEGFGEDVTHWMPLPEAPK